MGSNAHQALSTTLGGVGGCFCFVRHARPKTPLDQACHAEFRTIQRFGAFHSNEKEGVSHFMATNGWPKNPTCGVTQAVATKLHFGYPFSHKHGT